MCVALDNPSEVWFVIAAMRASWPDASKVDSFEGRVLSRAMPLVDFRLPHADQQVGVAEESVLFVAPPGYPSHPASGDGCSHPASGGPSASGQLWADVEYDVDVEAEGISLSPIPRPPLVTDVSVRHSTPGAHWLVAPPTLPPDDPRMSGSYTETGWNDENTLTLPVFPLHRRRRGLEADRIASSLLGSTTSARATRLGLAVAGLFAVLAVKSLDGRAPTLEELTQMGKVASVVAAPPNVASVPRVVVPARPPQPPAIIRADAPVWIVAPRRGIAPPPVLPIADHPLGLPRPPPAPRTEVARL
jgi:hypothetical protein